MTRNTFAKSGKEDGIPEDVEFEGEEPLTTDRPLMSEHGDKAPVRKNSSVHFPQGLLSSQGQNSSQTGSPIILLENSYLDAKSNR
jgi:hypothetical protein